MKGAMSVHNSNVSHCKEMAGTVKCFLLFPVFLLLALKFRRISRLIIEGIYELQVRP